MATVVTPQLLAGLAALVSVVGFAVVLGFRQAIYSRDAVKRRHSRMWLGVVLSILTPLVLGLIGWSAWLWFSGP